jgi:hypothetical protein
LIAASRIAHADHHGFHFTLSGDVAYTDNVFAQSSGAEGDAYGTIRPGVLFAYDAPRMIHDLAAEIELLDYARHSDSYSVTGRAAWNGLFLPGPRTSILTDASFATGKTTALNARDPSDVTQIVVTPAGQIDTLQVGADESLSYTAGKATRLGQNFFSRYGTTDDGMGSTTDTRAVGLSGTYERTSGYDLYGATVGLEWLRLERAVPGGDAGGEQGNRLDRQINPRAMASWRHDWGRTWSTALDAGLVYVIPYAKDPNAPAAEEETSLLPQGDATVAYTDLWGRASLGVHRTVAPNQFLAQNTVNTGVSAQVGVPLPWLTPPGHNPVLAALGTAGFEQTKIVDTESTDPSSTFDIFRADVSVAYAPKPNETFSLRYEYSHQTGNANADMLTPSYSKQTVYFTFAFRWPDRVEGAVPQIRQSNRADRSDLAPVGTEPVVPQGYEQPAQNDSSSSSSSSSSDGD